MIDFLINTVLQDENDVETLQAINVEQSRKIENLNSQIDLWQQIAENTSATVSKAAKVKLILTNTRQTATSIRHSLRTLVLPTVKFVNNRQLISTTPGSIGWTVCKDLQIPQDQFADFWAVHWNIAEGEFTSHKTQLTSNAKLAFEKGMNQSFIMIC